MKMTGFICHDDYLNKTAKLTDEEVGRLFRACMTYHITGQAEELEGRESIAFDFIKEDIDRAEKAYQSKCEVNKKNRLSKLTTDNNRQPSSTSVYGGHQPSTDKKAKDEAKEKKLNELFNRFWSAYPRHEAKAAAMKAFEKLKPTEEVLSKMIAAIEKQKQTEQWKEDGGKYIPHPATWLNNKRWEDEVAVTKSKAIPADNFNQRDYSDVQDEMMANLAKEMEMFKASGE